MYLLSDSWIFPLKNKKCYFNWKHCHSCIFDFLVAECQLKLTCILLIVKNIYINSDFYHNKYAKKNYSSHLIVHDIINLKDLQV